MKTALKILAALLICAFIGAVAFRLGNSFTLAIVLREGLATDTVQRVYFLQQFRSDLPAHPRSVLEAELAYMVYNLDSALHRKWTPFLDRDALHEARDKAVIYFHVFPLASRLQDASAIIIAKFAADPLFRDLGLPQQLRPKHQHDIATDATLERLLREFDPVKLDSNNRRFFDELTAQNKKP